MKNWLIISLTLLSVTLAVKLAQARMKLDATNYQTTREYMIDLSAYNRGLGDCNQETQY